MTNDVREISVRAVVVRDRLRALSESTVNELAESMSRVGLLNPITVHQPNVSPILVAGHHRLAAAKKLGWETIRCYVLPSETSADDLRLSEIDENLARGELSPAERALHIEERKAIYERIHGKAKANSARAANRAMGRGVVTENFSVTSFSKDTAEKTGRTDRSVRQDAARAKAIPNLSDVIGTSL